MLKCSEKGGNVRRGLVVFFSVLVLNCFNVYAATIGDSMDSVGAGKFKVSVGEKYTYEKDMKKGGTLTSASSTITSFDFKHNQTVAKLAYGVCDFMNVYAMLGNSRVNNAKMFFASNSEINVTSDYGILYGFGLSGKKDLGDSGFFVAADTSFNTWEVDVDDVEIEGNVVAEDIKGSIDAWQYQLSVIVGADIEVSSDLNLQPYVGLVYDTLNSSSDGIVSYKLGSTTYELNYDLYSSRRIGLVAGLNIDFLENWSINAELYTGSEESVSLGVSYKF